MQTGEILVDVSHFNEGHDGTCRIVGRFVLNVELRSHKAVLEVLVFHLERSSCVISPCTSPIRIDSNQIGRINTCTGTVGNDGADNLKLLLEMDGRLGTLIFYIAERTERNSIAYRTRPISIEQLNTVLAVSFNVAIIEAVGIK